MEIKKFQSGIWILFGILTLLTACASLESKKYDAEHYYLLGKAYETQGYYDHAKMMYTKSIEKKPDAIVYNALGTLYETLEQDISAIAAFEKGIETDSKDIENYFDASRIYLHLKEHEKAEETMLAALENSEEKSLAYRLLAGVYIKTGQWKEAESALKKSLEARPEAASYNDLGFVYQSLGNKSLAIENYQKALEIDPDYHIAEDNLARLKN